MMSRAWAIHAGGRSASIGYNLVCAWRSREQNVNFGADC